MSALALIINEDSQIATISLEPTFIHQGFVNDSGKYTKVFDPSSEEQSVVTLADRKKK